MNALPGGSQRHNATSLVQHIVLTALSVLAASLLASCLDRPIGTPQPVTTNVFSDLVNQTRIDQIDLLFMIDNSASMSDKQAILETAVPDLVGRLVNPICIDASGGQHPAAAPGESCPAGQRREFRAVNDINVGIVSSSLGDAAAGLACAEGETQDHGHLIGSLERGQGLGENELGFIAWRPDTDADRFTRDFQSLVRSVGEDGCGWEASLEAWYRFLIDPVPYLELERAPCRPGSDNSCTLPRVNAQGEALIDEALLEQRAAFLRETSLLVIVMLTDENDCSLVAGGQSWLPATYGANVRPMLAGSAACADNPNDACCYTCAAGPPEGCEWADTPCAASEEHAENRLRPSADGLNLRCFDQKRRFGIDFLYPTQRYVNALTELSICPSQPSLDVADCPGMVVENPLFAGGRAPASVFLTGIVGVPWQDIAADVDESGAELADEVLRFKPATELTPQDWDRILGDPSASPPRPPTNPLMQESDVPRPGVGVGGPNGREYDTAQTSTDGTTTTDLQYACIFPLAEPRECANAAAQDGNSDGGANATPQNCDCASGGANKPLCEATPGETAFSTTQHWAKAYPGERQLEVLKGFGDNSIVASICARNVTDPSRPDFGYRPAIASIVDRLKEQLTRRCLPRALEVNENGAVPCNLVEALPASDGCECDPSIARRAPSSLLADNARRQLANLPGGPCGPDDPDCQRACLCEIEQIVEPSSLDACRNQVEPTASSDGWCYVASSDEQQLGNPLLVEDCPATEQRVVRIVGEGIRSGAVTVISCTGRSLQP